jgi:hypothetical protein
MKIIREDVLRVADLAYLDFSETQLAINSSAIVRQLGLETKKVYALQ